MSRNQDPEKFPTSLFALFKQENVSENVSMALLRSFCRLTATSVAILDTDTLCIEWMCNQVLDYEWRKSDRNNLMTLSEFIHKDDFHRLSHDLSHMRRFKLDSFESMYRIYDLHGEFNWDKVRCIPYKFDKHERMIQLLVFTHHLNHAIVNSQFLDQVIQERRETSRKLLARKISSREKEVLSLIGEAKTDEEIADALFISKKTVITHRRNLLRKLKAKNKLELMKIVSENGF